MKINPGQRGTINMAMYTQVSGAKLREAYDQAQAVLESREQSQTVAVA
jgi:hypothetical protein